MRGRNRVTVHRTHVRGASAPYPPDVATNARDALLVGVGTTVEDHPVVMGILNVTPDSFSDGGRYADVDAAIEHGTALRHSGADIVDVGGESTRPGAPRVDAPTEAARVV